MKYLHSLHTVTNLLFQINVPIISVCPGQFCFMPVFLGELLKSSRFILKVSQIGQLIMQLLKIRLNQQFGLSPTSVLNHPDPETQLNFDMYFDLFSAFLIYPSVRHSRFRALLRTYLFFPLSFLSVVTSPSSFSRNSLGF